MVNLRFAAVFGLLLLALGAFASVSVIHAIRGPGPFEIPDIPKNVSAVRLTSSTPGHGSGVVFAPGYILTAAHVVGDETEMKVHFADKSIVKADVMWTSKAKDIALLRFKDTGRVASSPLACRDAAIGEHVTAIGNPMHIGQLVFEGKVNGPVQTLPLGQTVFTTDQTILPGMSGGGVLDDAGNIVGIAIATAVTPIGMFPSWARVGFVVPSSVPCDLMARAA